MKFLSLVLFVLALITTNAFASYEQRPHSTTVGGTGSSSQTASRAVTTDASGHIVSSGSTTDTEIGYVHGVTSAIQTQLGGKEPTVTGTTSADYYRGDKTFQTLNTLAVPELTNLYFTNARAIASTLTAYSAGAGVVSSSDSILQALQKIDGNDALKLAIASFTDAAVTGKLLTGFTSGAGTVSASDSILQAIQKLDGNINALPGSNMVVVDGGNAAYAIQATDRHVRSTTTLTADRAYTLPTCDGSNIGELHEVKNLPAQTHNITLTAAGSDNIDGAATVTLLPGDSIPVVCAEFGSAGTWDIQ